MKQRKINTEGSVKKEKGRKKEEAYFSDLCVRNLLTLTRSKIWVISLSCAADRRFKK
jgi:hypothetical protein